MFGGSQLCPAADTNPVGDPYTGANGHTDPYCTTDPNSYCTTDANSHSDGCANAAAHRPPDAATDGALPRSAIAGRDTKPQRGPPTGGDDSSTFGTSPDPQDPNPQFVLPPGSGITGGAEVRNLQLARTGPERVGLLATVAGSLFAFCLGLVATGRRRGARIS